jgi:pimeloyl-ACP methyl ester carboxylesterase
MRDEQVELPDGRVISYTDIGEPAGPVAFYFHGAPTSRFDLATVEDELTARGVRVLSPDRPGYGGSTPQPDRSLLGWPTDVAALADRLDLDAFAVVGLSSGGPYAVACAARPDPRLTGAAVVAGVTDMSWSGARDGLVEDEVEAMRHASQFDDLVAWCEQRYGADGGGFLDSMEDLAPADEALLAEPDAGTALFTSVIEAFRQGVVGYATDLFVESQAWAFDPGAITVPVTIWHGEDDTLVPTAHARHTAELIPDARLTIVPAQGHISMYRLIPEIVAELV